MHNLHIARVEAAIQCGWDHKSGLPESASEVHGGISTKGRHLLNNLCAAPGTVYLEIGLWLGASLISALAGNEQNVKRAYAIDHWQQSPRPYCGNEAKRIFDKNIQTHLSIYGNRLTVLNEDLFGFDITRMDQPTTVFYFDADHTRTAEGVLRFANVLADPCILVLDDWNIHHIDQQWRDVEKQAPFRIAREWILPSNKKEDVELWWCGMYVAILTKSEGQS